MRIYSFVNKYNFTELFATYLLDCKLVKYSWSKFNTSENITYYLEQTIFTLKNIINQKNVAIDFC